MPREDLLNWNVLTHSHKGAISKPPKRAHLASECTVHCMFLSTGSRTFWPTFPCITLNLQNDKHQHNHPETKPWRISICRYWHWLVCWSKKSLGTFCQWQAEWRNDWANPLSCTQGACPSNSWAGNQLTNDKPSSTTTPGKYGSTLVNMAHGRFFTCKKWRWLTFALDSEKKPFRIPAKRAQKHPFGISISTASDRA